MKVFNMGIKINMLLNVTRSLSLMNQDSLFPLVMITLMSGESHMRDMIPNT